MSEINLGRKNVVVGLIEQSRGVPTTVRLRLGRKYEETVSAGRVLELLSRVLVLPRYERLEELEALHASLRSSIGVAEREFAVPDQSSAEKLANGRKLQAALEEALANRRELAELGKEISADERRYTGRLAGLAPELAALARAVGEDRVSDIEAELAEIVAEEEAIAAELAGAKPRSGADLERLRGRIETWEGLIARRDELHAELTSLEGELGEAERERAAGSPGRLADARQRLQSAERGVQIGAAVSRLQRLHDQAPGLRADLLTSQTGAGDLQQAEAAMSALGRSIDERRRLARQLDSLGRKVSDPVLEQIDSDQAELARFQTVLEAERGSAEARQLDRAYEALEAEFLEIIDTYTLAFGTPQQLPEARSLLAHLRKMQQNRQSASELGSAGAASELSTVDGQIEDLIERNPGLR